MLDVRVWSKGVWGRRVAGVSLAMWFAAMCVVSAGMLARHLVAFQPPSAGARLGASLGALRPPGEAGWLAVHVLYSDCLCSRLVMDHLTHTRRPAGWREMVLWVGDEPPPELIAAFPVRRVTSAELARMGVEAAPTLAVVDPENRVVYAGGYTERALTPPVLDLRILESARAGAAFGALPVFGCAVSQRLQGELAALPSL